MNLIKRNLMYLNTLIFGYRNGIIKPERIEMSINRKNRKLNNKLDCWYSRFIIPNFNKQMIKKSSISDLVTVKIVIRHCDMPTEDFMFIQEIKKSSRFAINTFKNSGWSLSDIRFKQESTEFKISITVSKNR